MKSPLVVLTVAALLGTAPLPARAPAAAPALLAVNRCNAQTADEAFAHVRDYDRHPPGAATPQLLARLSAIADVLTTLQEEREILDSICGTDPAHAQVFAEIAAAIAWALALEADIAARLNASCPAAAKALPQMMLSDAWLALARIVNDDSGAVPAIFNDVIPKVQGRAAAVDLKLPSWADTSAYWRDQVHAAAKTQAATCPSPVPQASPSPLPSPE